MRAGRPLAHRDELSEIERALEAIDAAEVQEHHDARAASAEAAADRQAAMLAVVARLNGEKMDALAAADAAADALVTELGRVRHLSAQIVAAAQRAGAPVPESLTWHALARRFGHLIGSALRPLCTGPRRLGDLQWLDAPSAHVGPVALDWIDAERKATAVDIAAILHGRITK